jgi:glycosyltransferase involved in cell wall biosynthesis
MRILFLTHRFHPDVGGIEVNSEVLAREFSASGHEVTLMTWSDDPGRKDFPYQVIRQPSLGQLLREHLRADVVYENNPCLRLAWPALFFGKASVVALRTWIVRTDGGLGLSERLKLLWVRRAACVIAVSDSIRLRNHPDAKVIGNPYRFELFSFLPELVRNKDFVFLGRLVSDKGVLLSLEALAKLGKSGPSASSSTLTIIGDGPQRRDLEQAVQRLNLQDRVVFTGELQGEDLVAELNAHRFLLVPSLWEEPFGNVALEGMACGCVPIVSDGGGLPDAVGKAGRVFRRGDVDALVEAMEEMLEEPEKVEQFKSQAASHLREHHPEVVGRRYLQAIEESLGKKKRA